MEASTEADGRGQDDPSVNYIVTSVLWTGCSRHFCKEAEDNALWEDFLEADEGSLVPFASTKQLQLPSFESA